MAGTFICGRLEFIGAARGISEGLADDIYLCVAVRANASQTVLLLAVAKMENPNWTHEACSAAAANDLPSPPESA